MKNSLEHLQNIASQVRRDIVRMVAGVASGHPGGSLGCADFFVALYFEAMAHNPKAFQIDGAGQDVFILSNGHISPVLYSVLARSGYFEVSELATFRKLGSRLQGHPSVAKHLPGVRVSTGSLGQGLSVALGVATAKKLNKDAHKVYALCGDGELQEGQVWEAAMYASAKKIDNIILSIDLNGKQIDGSTDEVLSLGDLKAKFTAFGWQVLETNGNNMQELLQTLNQAQGLCGKEKPVCILLKTEMGMGVDFMMGTHKWHGKSPNAEQLAQALAQLNETLGDY
jgi:transketolase